ncbi:MAG: GNAT family N-acetyltransferase [Nitriliruptoraceae bacterium]
MSAPCHGEVVLRGAEPRDLPALAALPGLSASTRRRLVAEVARANARPAGDTVVLVAVAGGEVLAAALGLLQADDGHVVDLAVAPSLRRRGIGRRLLSALVTELRTRGARAVTLEVRAGNLGALALYRGAGFVVEGHRPRYYPDGEDALLLWQHDPVGLPDTATDPVAGAELDAPSETTTTAGTAGTPGTAGIEGG